MSAETATSSVEERLVAAIEPWLAHMRWRRDWERWRERRINQERYQQGRLRQLAQLTGGLARLRLLDLGSGMGGFSVAAALSGAAVVASEYNRAYCEITALRAERHNVLVPVFNAAGEALPFDDSHFDAVVCWDVIEHVRDPQELLHEIGRVLRSGGVALLTAINRRAWVDPHYHMRGINWLPRPLAEQLIERRGRSKQGAAFRDMQRLSEMHYFTFRQFVALAQRLGFTVRDLREEALSAGTLHSPKRMRRLTRAALRRIGLERAAYRVRRRWVDGMFELALVKR